MPPPTKLEVIGAQAAAKALVEKLGATVRMTDAAIDAIVTLATRRYAPRSQIFI